MRENLVADFVLTENVLNYGILVQWQEMKRLSFYGII